jgi:hypothetical protein
MRTKMFYILTKYATQMCNFFRRFSSNSYGCSYFFNLLKENSYVLIK